MSSPITHMEGMDQTARSQTSAAADHQTDFTTATAAAAPAADKTTQNTSEGLGGSDTPEKLMPPPPKPGLDKAANSPGVILLKDTAKKGNKKEKDEVPTDNMESADFESPYYSSKAIAARLRPKVPYYLQELANNNRLGTPASVFALDGLGALQDVGEVELDF